MTLATDPVSRDLNQHLEQEHRGIQAYQERPNAEWQDIVDVLDERDLADHFWAGAGMDGFGEPGWYDESNEFCKKALEHIANQDDESLGKMFRAQIQNYFIGIAQTKLENRGRVKSHIEDLKTALEAN